MMARPLTAADVQHLDARAQSFDQAGRERQDRVEQRRDDRLGALLGHHLVEARVGGIRDSAAVAEAFHDGPPPHPVAG